MGSLEGLDWKHIGDLLDSYDDCKCCDLGCPRSNACHSRSRQLRPVARSGDEGCRHSVRIAEALRWPADAVLSRERSGQPCGERRPRMLDARGTRQNSEFAIFVVELRPPTAKAPEP